MPNIPNQLTLLLTFVNWKLTLRWRIRTDGKLISRVWPLPQLSPRTPFRNWGAEIENINEKIKVQKMGLFPLHPSVYQQVATVSEQVWIRVSTNKKLCHISQKRIAIFFLSRIVHLALSRHHGRVHLHLTISAPHHQVTMPIALADLLNTIELERSFWGYSKTA